jgi:hypothetical protein
MCRHLLRRHGDHRDLQASTNDFNDVPYRYSLFSDRDSEPLIPVSPTPASQNLSL